MMIINPNQIIGKIKTTIQEWNKPKLTMKGRVTVANQYLLSKIWYAAEIVPPRKEHIAKINSHIFKFVWGHKTEYVSRDTMFLPPSKGGLGILHMESKMAAMHCLHIGDMISDKEAKWISLAVYWCGHSVRSVAPALPRRNAP